MLHPEIKKVLHEISAHYGPGYENFVKNNPNACLLAILIAIKNELPEVSAMLKPAVQLGFFSGHIEKAQQLLGQVKTKSGRKADKKPIKAC